MTESGSPLDPPVKPEDDNDSGLGQNDRISFVNSPKLCNGVYTQRQASRNDTSKYE